MKLVGLDLRMRILIALEDCGLVRWKSFLHQRGKVYESGTLKDCEWEIFLYLKIRNESVFEKMCITKRYHLRRIRLNKKLR